MRRITLVLSIRIALAISEEFLKGIALSERSTSKGQSAYAATAIRPGGNARAAPVSI